MSIVRALIFWLGFWPFTISMYLGLWVFRAWYFVTRKPRFDLFVHRYASYWAKIIIWCTPGWSVEVRGREHIPQGQNKFVLVCNHESLTDIWVLFFLDMQFKWLAKAEVFKIPVIGRPMTWAGYIPIKRGDKASHAEALVLSARSVLDGVPMLYFPEGTRSNDGNMQPFKIGAFKLASDTNTFVLPVVLKGTRQLIPKGSLIPAASKVVITVLPPMYRRADEDYNSYATRTREAILEAHRKA